MLAKITVEVVMGLNPLLINAATPVKMFVQVTEKKSYKSLRIK
jgi:hypothetical protein